MCHCVLIFVQSCKFCACQSLDTECMHQGMTDEWNAWMNRVHCRRKRRKKFTITRLTWCGFSFLGVHVTMPLSWESCVAFVVFVRQCFVTVICVQYNISLFFLPQTKMFIVVAFTNYHMVTQMMRTLWSCCQLRVLLNHIDSGNLYDVHAIHNRKSIQSTNSITGV